MLKITLKGIPGYDGVYEFRMEDVLHKDLHTIKQLTGVRAGELNEALAAGDHDLIVAFTQIALERAGKPIHPELLWEAKLGSIEVEDVPEDDEENPTPVQPTGPKPDDGRSGAQQPSGAPTSSVSDIRPVNDPDATGSRGSTIDAA